MIVQLFALMIEIAWWQEWERFNLRLTFHWEPYRGIFISFPSFPRRHR